MEEKILIWIKKQIDLKKASGQRPLSVVHLDIWRYFNDNCHEELKTLVMEGKLHWGHTFNDKWFSIYDRNNLL